MRRVNPHRPQLAQRHPSPSPERKRSVLFFTKEKNSTEMMSQTHVCGLKSTPRLNTDFALDVNSVAFLPHLSLQ